MKSQQIVLLLSKALVLLSAFIVLAVSLMAFQNPQGVMDLVSVKLNNADAYSSIRGVYGGVGVTIFISLLYTMRKNIQESLGLLVILWGLYAISRIMTIFTEGALGSFGTQWLTIETFLCLASAVLLVVNKRLAEKTTTRISLSPRQ